MLQARGGTTLYNVMFPVWMLWIFPATWLVVLPVNFGIDLLVVVLTLKAMGVAAVKETAKRAILRVWLFGFVADFVGTALLFLANLVEFPGTLGDWWYDNLTNAVSFNPFTSIYAFLYVAICTFVSALSIYWLNRRFGLAKTDLDDAQKKRLALSLAVFTAPYLFFFPSAWLYGF